MIVCIGIFLFTTLYITAIDTTEQLLQEATACYDKQEYQTAITLYQQALAQSSCDIQHHFKLAYCYTALGEVDHAIAIYHLILKYFPHCISVIYNMGYVYKMKDDIDQAITYYEQAIALDPEREESYFGIGMAYLVKGDFETGWTIHERYLKRTGRNAELLRAALKDNTLAGKKILLRPEGGLGDTIQFLRYAKKLKECGAHVVAYVHKELHPLVSRCDYIDTLLDPGTYIPLDLYDHTTFMSMPAIWYSTYKEIPNELNYITPDPTLSDHWQTILAPDPHYKIGICWGASIHNDSSRHPVARRSIPLTYLYQLYGEHISLYSLQRFDGEEQLNDVPTHITIKTFGTDFDHTNGPFMDSAAIIPHLDLIISVDTATAHLAAALGKKVFLLLPYSTDWRWIAHRTDSPWYPTMRIFKQKKPFDWQSVMDEVWHAVQECMEKK